MKKLLLPATAILALVASPLAHAITITASVGGAPTGVNHVNFDNLTIGPAGGVATGPSGSTTVSFTGNGQTVSGAVVSIYAPPVLSGVNGVGFGPGGSTQASGTDKTPYLTTGNSSVTLDFGASSLKYFGLLWGSVDTYNTLKFYLGNTLVDTVTGTQVLSAPSGSQGVSGTTYVNINTTSAFNKVIATSAQFAFEFDNVAYSANPLTVPDGGSTIASLGLAMLGLEGFRRFRKQA